MMEVREVTLEMVPSETDGRVPPLALRETSLRIYPVETVLVAMYGGFNRIGRTGLLKIPAAVNQAITAVQSNGDKLDADYLLAMLDFNVEHWKSEGSSSRKDPNITSADIKAFRIAYQEIAEQRVIAAALSDADALISSLNRLISKKHAVKAAAMQQLLTGKQRLPGFDYSEHSKKTAIGELRRA
jgi:type I restriction enzyme, S subunit